MKFVWMIKCYFSSSFYFFPLWYVPYWPTRGQYHLYNVIGVSKAFYSFDYIYQRIICPHRGQCTGGNTDCSRTGKGGGGKTEKEADGDNCEGDSQHQQQHQQDAHRFEYHAVQLERFLREYRCLQEQLVHMKQSYQTQQLQQQLGGTTPRYGTVQHIHATKVSVPIPQRCRLLLFSLLPRKNHAIDDV